MKYLPQRCELSYRPESTRIKHFYQETGGKANFGATWNTFKAHNEYQDTNQKRIKDDGSLLMAQITHKESPCVWTFTVWSNIWCLFTYRTEKDKAAQSPYLSLRSDGKIMLRNDMVVVSSCTMYVYKFPFDSQKCNLTFKSMIHSSKFGCVIHTLIIKYYKLFLRLMR